MSQKSLPQDSESDFLFFVSVRLRTVTCVAHVVNQFSRTSSRAYQPPPPPLCLDPLVLVSDHNRTLRWGKPGR